MNSDTLLLIGGYFPLALPNSWKTHKLADLSIYQARNNRNAYRSLDMAVTPQPISTLELLWTRAVETEAFLHRHFMDANGVVISWLDKQTLLPPAAGFFPPPREDMSAGEDCYVSGFARSEVAAYENCGMCTGAGLMAAVYRHLATGDAAALELAWRLFAGLRYIYETGRQLEEGFFPKIFGGRFSMETSTDQMLYAVFALDQYAVVAPPAQQEEIARMIPAMVNFWVKRNYIYTYRQVVGMPWPIMRFPPLLRLAAKYSDAPIFRAEYERLLADPVPQLPEWAWLDQKRDGRREISDFERKEGGLLVANMADCLTMDVMNLDLLLRLDPDHPRAEQWRQGIATMWDHAMLTLVPNGKIYAQVLVDNATGTVRRTPGHPAGGPHGAETGWSTMVARGAVTAARHLPDRRGEIRGAVLHILEQIGIPDMTYLDEPDRLPPHLRFKTKVLSGDSISNWLWAFWQARFDGLLD